MAVKDECVFLSFRLEAAKDDYRIHCEELEKQLIEVQHRNDELTSLAEESRALKDELDVLRFVSVWGCILCVNQAWWWPLIKTTEQTRNKQTKAK